MVNKFMKGLIETVKVVGVVGAVNWPLNELGFNVVDLIGNSLNVPILKPIIYWTAGVGGILLYDAVYNKEKIAKQLA